MVALSGLKKNVVAPVPHSLLLSVLLWSHIEINWHPEAVDRYFILKTVSKYKY